MKRLTFLLILALAQPALADPLAIIVGDSIAHTYPDEYDWPIQGWGAYLPQHFRATLQWRNDARGGASTKSFIDEGWWAETLAANPQFILIQLGTNEGQADPAHHTEPNTTYRENLHRMIVDAREIGALPILITPPAIRYVAADGVHVLRPGPLQIYASAMIAQASADGVGIIDMHGWSLDLYDELGMPLAQELFGFLIPGGGDPPIPPDTPDLMHFSLYGANQAAAMIASRLPTTSPFLGGYLSSAPAPALPFPAAVLLIAALGIAALRAR